MLGGGTSKSKALTQFWQEENNNSKRNNPGLKLWMCAYCFEAIFLTPAKFNITFIVWLKSSLVAVLNRFSIGIIFYLYNCYTSALKIDKCSIILNAASSWIEDQTESNSVVLESSSIDWIRGGRRFWVDILS